MKIKPFETQDRENPFSAIGFIRFFLISSVFIATLPWSVLIGYMIFGEEKLVQFLKVLFKEFFQLFIVGLVMLFLCAVALYYIFQAYLAPIFW